MEKSLHRKFKSTLQSYSFRPKWSLTFLMLATLICFLKLGFWQLDRAKEKDLLQQRFEMGLRAIPTSLNELPKDTSNWPYLSVTVTGHYDNAHNILLDNKFHKHQVGYEVLTPLRVVGDTRTILVNRGWVPAPRQRSSLPHIPDISGEHNIIGLIYMPPEKPFTLEKKNLAATVNWPYRVQTLDIAHLQKTLNAPLFPFIIQLDKKQDHGFVRDWQPINLSLNKHLGYAVQWFTFALVLIIIFVALSLKRKKE
jgi:surfeit locus 1 family protein